MDFHMKNKYSSQCNAKIWNDKKNESSYNIYEGLLGAIANQEAAFDT